MVVAFEMLATDSRISFYLINDMGIQFFYSFTSDNKNRHRFIATGPLPVQVTHECIDLSLSQFEFRRREQFWIVAPVESFFTPPNRALGQCQRIGVNQRHKPGFPS